MSLRTLVENKSELDYKALTSSLIAEFGITDTINWDAVIPANVQQSIFGGETLRLFEEHPNFSSQKDIRTILLKKGETSQILILFAVLKDEKLSKINIERITKKFIGGFSAERYVVWFLGNPSNTQFKVVLSGKEGKKFVLKSLTFEVNQPFYKTYEYILNEVYNKTNMLFVEPSERWNALWSAFNISVVNKQFYNAIKNSFDDLVENILDKSIINSLEKKKNFAIRLIGRVIFCWFLKKKKIVSEEVLSSATVKRYTNYYRELLEKLFFDVFNTPTNQRKSNLPTDIILYPFLNGGLFEAQEDDYRDNFQLFLPNEWFYELFHNTLERFNFTIDENSSTNEELAIDPEMLGRIFENLLAEHNPETKLSASDRKVTGAYYTPRDIVDYMVEQSISEFLKANLRESCDHSLIEDFVHTTELSVDIKPLSKTILELLNSVKVLDPACGSGAFAIGVLQKLLALKQVIIFSTHRFKSAKQYYKLKLETIQKSIYGSDIQPLATELSRLRCWLTLMVDEDVQDIQPLPNLNFKFITSNSLVDLGFDEMLSSIESKKGGGLLFLNKFIELKDKIINLTSEYYNSSTEQNQKYVLHSRFKELQEELTRETLSLVSSYPSISNFATRFLNWEPFNDNSVAPFFSSSLMYGITEGFDIIIGNPPYIKEYTNKSAFDEIRNSEYYQGKMDIWYFFASRFIDYLKPNTGILTFIATNNWTTNSGASKFRNKVITDSQILQLIDFGSYMIFESASIQTMILILLHNKVYDNYAFDYRKLEGEYLTFSNVLDLLQNKPSSQVKFLNPTIIRNECIDKLLTFGSDELSNILSRVKIKANFYLNENTEVAQGIVPNPDVISKKSLNKIPLNKQRKFNINVGDPVFVVPINFFPTLTNEEKAVLKPLYEPTDISRYNFPSKYKKQIIYITKSTKIINLPSLLNHLEKYREIMEDRRENRKGLIEFYHLHWPRTEYYFEDGPKILSVRKCSYPTFVYTEEPAYVMMSFNIIRSNEINLKYLTAILNSTLVAFWLKNKGKMQGNNYQIDKEPLLQIPIRKIKETKPFEILVDYLNYLQKSHSVSDKQLMINYFESILDAMTFEVYFEEELNHANKNILQYLMNLENLSADKEQNNKIVTDTFKALYDKDHIVRKNIYYMDSIEEVKLIKNSLSNQKSESLMEF